MPVGLGQGVEQVGLQVGRLVQEHPEEEVAVQVAVDAYLVEIVAGIRAAVVAQLAPPPARDVEVHAVARKVLVHPLHRPLGQVAAEDEAVAFGGRHP